MTKGVEGRVSRRYHYWILTRDPDTGQPYLIYGSPSSEDACRQKGLEMLGGLDFDIRRLPTRNLQMASSMVRGKRLEETKSLTKAKKRLGHEKSLARMRKRRGQYGT